MGVWGSGIGAGLSLLIRKEIRCKGSFLNSEQFYYAIVTGHAFIMVFFVVMPVLGAGLSNWLLPFMCLHKDIALPRINALSLWIVFPALLFLGVSLNTEEGRGTGWTVYPPLSGEGHGRYRVDVAIFSLHIAGGSSLIGAINFITTIHARGEGVQGVTLRVLCWRVGVIRGLLILSLPVFAGAVTLLLFDRNARARFYVWGGGGDPVLYQHLFWFLGHPEVYILILPGLGVIRHLIVWGTGNNSIYGRGSLVIAIVVIGVMGCLVWAHHMFTVGLDLDTRAYLIAVTMGIALPTGIKLYRWNARIIRSPLRRETVNLWVYGLICMFTLGGTTGVILANTVIDILLHDTFLVVGHFHYVLRMGAIIRMGAGLLLWGALLRGITTNKVWRIRRFLSFFIGVNATFLPTHLVGLRGGPRRYNHLPDLVLSWLKIRTYGSVLSFNSFCAILFSLFIGWVQLRVIVVGNTKTGGDLLRRRQGVVPLLKEIKVSA